MRPHRAAICLVSILICHALALSAPALPADPIIGRASVIDGDTIEIRGQHIRLAAMDALESRQQCHDKAGKAYRCGQRAALFFADLIGTKTVMCQPAGKSWDRVVAICRVGDVELAAAMVRRGWAVDDDRYHPDHTRAKRRAQENGAGAWRGTFRRPRARRKDQQ